MLVHVNLDSRNFLFLIVGALGYLQGALRLIVSLVGLFLGLMLAFPLAPLLANSFRRLGSSIRSGVLSGLPSGRFFWFSSSSQAFHFSFSGK